MNCLSQLELEKTLCEPESELSERWESHLADCEACRSRLEEFAGSESEWQSTCRVLGEISSESHSDNEDIWSAPDTIKGENYQSTIFYRLDWQGDSLKTGRPDDSHSDVELDTPSHPENLGRVGRYEVERSIGRGGMGIVFKGFDAELNRPVAIKILSPHLAGHGTARQRFTREAKAAAAVVHDNVVPIFDIHADSKQPYLVMPFVNGVSLQDYVDQRGQLGTENILQVALQIASGLAAAHAQGLIHRDIKPANILLENGLNRVQITDFGLARAVDDAAMTHSGMIAGTPHYMSPEQAKGDSLDHRSDLFSLGCVMYFMATGRTLHRGEGPFSIISQLCRGKYTPVREINSKIPAYVSDIIDKLLELEAQDRFQSTAHLAQHLEKTLAHLQQPTGQKAPRKIWSSRKKKSIRRGAIAATCLLTFAAVAVISWPYLQSDRSNPNEQSGSSASSSLNESPMLAPMSDIERELTDIEASLSGLEQTLTRLESTEYQTGQNLQVELWELEGELTRLGAPGIFQPADQNSTIQNRTELPSQTEIRRQPFREPSHQSQFEGRQLSNPDNSIQNGSTENPKIELPIKENEDQP